MTSYNSQVTRPVYKIQFETDDPAHYERVQQTIRDCIDDSTRPCSDGIEAPRPVSDARPLSEMTLAEVRALCVKRTAEFGDVRCCNECPLADLECCAPPDRWQL